MENVTKLNLIKQGETAPAVERDKEKIRRILLDVLGKVDTETCSATTIRCSAA